MKFVIFAVVILLAVSGCASTPIKAADSKPVPDERVYLNEKLPPEGNARVFFIRDAAFAGLFGAGLYHHVYINGVKAVSLNPGEKASFVLAPGEYIFGAIPTDPFNQHSLNSIDQDIKANRQYFYRVQTDGQTRTAIHRFFPDSE
jgi:hypothetical protein